MLPDDPELERIKQRKIKEMMSASHGVSDLDDVSFDQAVSSETPTLVDFWAEWCGPCKMMHPVFESMNAKFPQIRFARLNVDQSPKTAAKYGIQSIPTFMMFRSGRAVDTMQGAVGMPGIHMICKKYSD